MQKMIALLAVLMMFASGAFAVEIQGEILQIKGDQVVIELFKEGASRVKVGNIVRGKAVPGNVPTLNMLQG